jgi:hypothetical protein
MYRMALAFGLAGDARPRFAGTTPQVGLLRQNFDEPPAVSAKRLGS